MKTPTSPLWLALCAGLVFATPAVAQSPQTVPTDAERPLPSSIPDTAHEAKLAAAEKEFGGFAQRNAPSAEYRRYPYLAYFTVFDKAYAEAVEKAKAQRLELAAAPDVAVPQVKQDSGITPYTFGMLGSFSASHNAASLGASTGWLAAGTAFFVLDLLANASPAMSNSAERQAAMKEQEALFQRRLATVTKPSISFVRYAPGAEEKDDLYYEAKAGEGFVRDLGLGCEPAILHGPTTPVFVGGANRAANYIRKYVCGYAPGENVPEGEAANEVREFTAMAFSLGEPMVHFSLYNLQNMTKLREALGRSGFFATTSDLGRVVYEKVKDRVSPEWTIIFTAPNERGSMAVFVARAGNVAEFPTPK